MAEASSTAVALARAGSAWRAVGARLPLPTQSYEWAESCVDAFAGSGELRVPVANGRGFAAATLLRRSQSQPFELCGVAELFEPCDFAYGDHDSLAALSASLAEAKTPLRLARVPVGSPTIAAVERAYRRRGLTLARPSTPCPWIPLDGAPVDSLLSSSLSADLRRSRRKAESLGTVSYEVIEPGAGAQLAPVMAEALAVEASGWKGRAGTALLHDEARRRFFERYTERAWQSGILRLCMLRIDGAAAAMNIATSSAGRFNILKIGYDERFASCSPGLLALYETLRHAAREGHASFELLGSPAPWTRRWTETERPCLDLRAYPLSSAGARWAIGDAAALSGALARKLRDRGRG